MINAMVDSVTNDAHTHFVTYIVFCYAICPSLHYCRFKHDTYKGHGAVTAHGCTIFMQFMPLYQSTIALSCRLHVDTRTQAYACGMCTICSPTTGTPPFHLMHPWTIGSQSDLSPTCVVLQRSNHHYWVTLPMQCNGEDAKWPFTLHVE